MGDCSNSAGCCAERCAPTVRFADSVLTTAQRWDHWIARWGIKRSAHRVAAGLYALGHPTPESPVFVSASYTLSFDALRTALRGVDAYILVLDTKGVNVWCAAGKGTFGTEELVARIESVGLAHRVTHRRLIVPQLGAPGIAAHEVRARTGFRVDYGPVRAADLPRFLATGSATEEMRSVRFGLRERVVLIPVELVHVLMPMLVAAVLLFFAGGALAVGAALAACIGGVVLFPILLPWLPTQDFTSKGLILGAVLALPFAAAAFLMPGTYPQWLRAGYCLGCLLALPAVTAFLALNFTGSTTFTSPSGVRREILVYTRVMAICFLLGALLCGVMRVLQVRGGR